MELNNYPHFDLTEDGRLCSTGQHCPGFPRVLYDALIHLGYDGDAPVYRCRLSMIHGMDQCEVSVMIPLDPTEPWLGFIIYIEPNTDVELMAHLAHLLVRGLPHLYRSAAYRASPDSESREPCMVATS
jgi:hypothetical protein